jgi:hypothetical protein
MAIATSRIRLWLASGWKCGGRQPFLVKTKASTGQRAKSPISTIEKLALLLFGNSALGDNSFVLLKLTSGHKSP